MSIRFGFTLFVVTIWGIPWRSTLTLSLQVDWRFNIHGYFRLASWWLFCDLLSLRDGLRYRPCIFFRWMIPSMSSKMSGLLCRWEIVSGPSRAWNVTWFLLHSHIYSIPKSVGILRSRILMTSKYQWVIIWWSMLYSFIEIFDIA